MPLPSPSGRPFLKMHGLGNDFVIIDARTMPWPLDPAAVRMICNRHTGVGGDQVLVIEPASTPAADARMRIYNVDGTESETCLNATRCVTWLLLRESGAERLTLETLGGLIEARDPTDAGVTISVAAPRTDWQAIPLAHAAGTLALDIVSGPLAQPTALSFGNPHVVFFVPDRDAIDVPRWAAPVQAHPLLPQSANVGVAQMVAPDRIRLVVYERPGILTEACGSGACAAVVAAGLRGLTDRDSVTVEMPGGILQVTRRSDGRLDLTGPVAIAFAGQLNGAP